MAGLIACVTAIFQNAYTDRDISYLNAKGFDVFICLKNRVSGEIHVKSQIPHDEVKNHLCKEQRAGEENIWISQKNKGVFPRTPGNIRDIIKDSNRVQKFASTLMAFWRKNILGGVKIGGGIFTAWNEANIDIPKVPLITDILERASEKLGGIFTLKMDQILRWEDLKGIPGLAAGKAKSLLVPWTWVEWQIFFIFWSFQVAGINILTWTEAWSPSDDDFMPGTFENKVKIKVLKQKEKPLSKSKQQKRKKTAGADLDTELALALSISVAQVVYLIIYSNIYIF